MVVERTGHRGSLAGAGDEPAGVGPGKTASVGVLAGRMYSPLYPALFLELRVGCLRVRQGAGSGAVPGLQSKVLPFAARHHWPATLCGTSSLAPVSCRTVGPSYTWISEVSISGYIAQGGPSLTFRTARKEDVSPKECVSGIKSSNRRNLGAESSRARPSPHRLEAGRPDTLFT